MPRGGARQGKRGVAYPNRSDLSPVKPPLPPTAATGQPYGVAGAQLAAQKALPMSGAPVVGGPPPGAPPAGVAASSPPTPAGTPPTSLGLPEGTPGPGQLPPLDAPTNRPDEHMFHGSSAPGGAGPEALTPMIAHPMLSAVASLNMIPNPPAQVKAILASVNASLGNQAAV